MPHALVIDDDPTSLRCIVEVLQNEGFEVSTAVTLKEARGLLEQKAVDVFLLDLVLPDGSGLEILKNLKTRSRSQGIVITGHASIETIVEALRLGACDYLTKPVELGRLKAVLANVVRTIDLNQEIDSLRDQLRELGQFGPLVGVSPAMQEVYDLIAKVAPTDASVFVHGESGTGKELVAQAIHQFSRRHRGPFLPVNCGAISANLMESELFGHEKGSFTGADRLHRGFFERTAGGTLFLDEITEMPVELQVKLLRVLESGTVLRIGTDQPIPIDVRVVAATNRCPQEAVAAGKLREDLLYRLNVFPIELPPLRRRGDDVVLLAGKLLGEMNKAGGTSKKLTAASIERLRSHSWPGNVRELKNVLQRAFIIVANEITPESLLDLRPAAEAPPGSTVPVTVGMTLEEAEKRLVEATFRHFEGDKQKTAEVLGISLRTLYNRLREGEPRPA